MRLLSLTSVSDSNRIMPKLHITDNIFIQDTSLVLISIFLLFLDNLSSSSMKSIAFIMNSNMKINTCMLIIILEKYFLEISTVLSHEVYFIPQYSWRLNFWTIVLLEQCYMNKL